MKGKEFESFARRWLLPRLGGFAVQGRLLFASPVADVLRGIAVEPCTGGGFYANAFVLPLYVRAENLVLDFGRRLSASHCFEFADDEAAANAFLEAICEEGLFVLDSLGTPEAFAERATAIVPSNGVHVREAVASSLIVIGRTTEARPILASILPDCESGLDRSPWLADLAREVEELLVALDAGRATELLAERRQFTLNQLGLTPFALADTEVTRS